jgi:Protein-L-isoaspartate carboxylmethyltransferase
MPAMNLDYAQARENMVEQQVRPWDVLDLRVLEVIARTPREAFVDAAYRELAYADLSLPIGEGEFMMKPVIEGRALQALLVQPHERVLEIGTGSGYLTACLAQLAARVYSLEIRPALADKASRRLAESGHANATVETADALAWQAGERYDAICVTGAVAEIPPRFKEWLAPGGRLFVIHGLSPVMEAALLREDVNGMRTESLFETDLPYLAGGAPAPRFVL